MPDPSAADVLALGGASGGRMSLAVTEAKRLLTAVLPGTVTLANTREGTSLPVPNAGDFYYSGESLAQANFPAIAVGGDAEFVPLSGLAMRRTPLLEVFVIQPRIEIGSQIVTLWDLGELAMLTLLTAQGQHCLPAPDNRPVWSQLKPLRMEVFTAKADNTEYSGVKVSLQMDQGALSLWPQS